VPQTIRVGAVFRADAYLPKAAGSVPALLERTLYGKAEPRGQVAFNTVFHDAARPSRIILPCNRGGQALSGSSA
jgi:hypothetical protein